MTSRNWRNIKGLCGYVKGREISDGFKSELKVIKLWKEHLVSLSAEHFLAAKPIKAGNNFLGESKPLHSISFKLD